MSRANARRVDRGKLKQQRQLRGRKILRISGGAMLLAISLSALFLLNKTFHISEWEIAITGAAPKNLEQQLNRAMQSLPDSDLWSTRPQQLRKHLLTAVPDLKNIQIQRSMTGSLKLRATARTAIGLWQAERGKVFLVDSDGNAYRRLQASEMADLPMLRINETELHAAATLLQIMRLQQPVHFSHISELFSDQSSWKINFNRGQQWMLSRSRNRSGLDGSELEPSNLYAINRISELLKKPRWRSGQWRVDARTATRWFIRPTRYEGVI